MNTKCVRITVRMGTLLLVGAAALASPCPGWGQAPAAGGAAAAPRPPRVLSISAQATARPDLAYTLTPRMEDTVKGNAAVKYMSAVTMMPRSSEEDNQLINRLAVELPVDSLDERDSQAARVLGEYRTALQLLREGARMESADWETNIRQNGLSALLPALGDYRRLSNVLAAQIRLDIKRGDWQSACDRLQTGYALARHLGAGETLVESLVGIAIAGRMNTCLEDWVSRPGAPNLYWPLSNLPRPFNDLRRPMAMEKGFVFYSLPQMRQMREGRYSAEIWRSVIAEFGYISGSTGGGPGLPPTDTLSVWQRDIAGAAAGALLYPQAKRYLRERGYTVEQVERMAVPEALGRYFVGSFDETYDDMFKWMGLPPGQCLAGLKEWSAEFERQKAANQANLPAGLLLPSLHRAVASAVKVDRQVAALRFVEALRDHVARTDNLPDTPNQLKLPLPSDPLGTAFEYRRQGNTAMISSVQEPDRDSVRYEVTLRR